MLTGNERFQRWKKRAGVKNAVIARLLNVDVSQVWRWENTDARPDLVQRRLLERLSRGRVSADSWLTEKERKRLRDGVVAIDRELAA